VNYTPYIDAAVKAGVEIGALGLVWFVTKGIPSTVAAVQKKFNLQISAQQSSNLTTQAENAATWAFMQIPDMVTKLGWAHADVITEVIRLATPMLAAKAPGTLADVGLTSDLTDASNKKALEDLIARAIPAAAAKAVASPATPPANAGVPVPVPVPDPDAASASASTSTSTLLTSKG
jgi:hypothetical protein